MPSRFIIDGTRSPATTPDHNRPPSRWCRHIEATTAFDGLSHGRGLVRMGKAVMIVFAIAIFSAAVPSTAQDVPSGKWWKDPRIAKELNLTSGETNQLDRLFTSSRRRLIDLKSRVEKEQFEYQDAIEKKTLDEAAVGRQFQRLEKARTSLAEERNKFVVGVRKILGYERFQLLKDIYRRRN
ncbi:MAG: periplasmic heavy metal sensor [Desulfobacterales bacterium]|jgi:Spy/CpxP family protein refolding chaperone